MNVLVLGGGGREHALALKISESKHCQNLFVAPGNAGTKSIATNISVDVNNFEAVKEIVLKHQIDMLVVGPEAPLVNGITDFFNQESSLSKVKVIGPTQAGAELEGSKERAKRFMQRHQIPTAAYQSFDATSIEEGKKFLEKLKAPYVLKADGLAAGKGVLILDDLEVAKKELEAMLGDAKFGAASSKVVIEEFLDGIELSVFVLTDGKNHLTLPAAKDYKRIGEGDTGLNTGGMGAISPVPFVNNQLMEHIENDIVLPTVNGLQEEGIDYKGFIFIGLMKVNDKAYVIEYNVRMGDPETEVVIPRIKSDFLETLDLLSNQKLDEAKLEINQQSAATVMLVSGGYPEAYEKGKEITGIDQVKDALVFHAGTKNEGEKVLTNGGRVIAVTAFGDDFEKALKTAYQNADKINFDKKYLRTDLGEDLK
ncbi:MAG: phosphoribosylamine--glycine ligase [Bacteroidota bacterium]